MLQEIMIAALKAGLPVGLASYALVWWALKNDYLGSVASLKDVAQEVKRHSKDKAGKKNRDPIHNKWIAFGGGFYGVVGLLTYVVVELGEIRDFFQQFESIGALISSLSIGLFIGLIIDGLMNFIVAIAWPAYWISSIGSGHIWIWFAVAYAGYWAGVRIALHQENSRDQESD
jgi:hypothetical protein